MSTAHQFTVRGEITEVVGDPDISLDDREFGPDDDPSDRLDEYVVTIKLTVHTEEEVEALRSMADAERSVLMVTEF